MSSRFYVGYNVKNNVIGVFTDINEYRIADASFKEGKLRKMRTESLDVAKHTAVRIITTAFDPPIPEDILDKYSHMGTNRIYTRKDLMKDVPKELLQDCDKDKPPYDVVF